MGSATAATPRARALAGLLAEAVADSGLSDREIGRRMDVSHMSIGRWKRGEAIAAPETVATLLAHLGVTGERRDQILAIARGVGEADWLATGPPGISQQLAGVLEYERTAHSMTDWSPLVIPGMLQTADYARAVIGGGTLPYPAVETRVHLRLGRRDAIMRSRPIHLTSVIGSAAIRNRIGGAQVMIDQLRLLLAIGERPNVTLRVAEVDDGWHPGLMGPFVLYEFPDLPSIVHLEHHRASAFLSDKADVASYEQLAHSLINDVAVSPEQSREEISEQIQKWETTE